MTRRRIWALASLIALMIVWGSTFVVTKAAVRDIPPMTLAALRFLIAAGVLIPIAAARGGLSGLPRPVPLLSLTLMSLTGIVIFTVGFNLALAYGSAVQGALIFSLVPAAVAIAAVIGLKEALSMRRIAGIALSVVGVALVVSAGERGGDAPQPLLGALFMLGAIVAWAVYTVLAKRLAAADQIVVIACVSAIGVLILLPLAAFELQRGAWPRPSAQAWSGVLFLGLVASAAAYIVYSRVLQVLDASLVGVYSNLDPIVGVLMAVLLLGENLHLGQIVGGAIAFAGMWLATVEGGVREGTRSARRARKP